MSNAGLEPMPDEVAISALSAVMTPEAPIRAAIVAADWPLLAAAYRTRGSLRSVDELLRDADEDHGESEFCRSLRDSPAERRRDLLAEHIGSLASGVIGLAEGQALDPTAGFFQLGMDSLMSVTLQRRLSASLGISLPAALIYEYPTVSSLTDALAERLGLPDSTDAPTARRSSLASRAAQRAEARRGAHAGTRRGRGV